MDVFERGLRKRRCTWRGECAVSHLAAYPMSSKLNTRAAPTRHACFCGEVVTMKEISKHRWVLMATAGAVVPIVIVLVGCVRSGTQPQPTNTIPSPNGQATELSMPDEPEAAAIAVGVSFVGRHQPGASEFWFHVDVLDKEVTFKPESIEVIDPTAHQVVSGPFLLTEKESELCGKILYETDGLDPSSHLPEGFWYRSTVEPYYIYRVTVRTSTGEQKAVDKVGRPSVCVSASE